MCFGNHDITMSSNHLPSLPIERLKTEILGHLQQGNRQPLIVEADTGSGKSTRLPLWARATGRVLVIEPRRLACTALAGYLAQQQDTPLGEAIGYAIHLDHRCRTDSQLVFATPGVALRWLSDGRLNDFATVILDEFHERRWDMDLLLALLKAKGRHQLILTSATIDGERLAGYLNGRRLHAPGRAFEVSTRHLAGDLRQMPTLSDIDRRVVDAVQQALAEDNGDILVFLPGRREIQACQQRLTPLAEQHQLLLIPLHSSASATHQRQALATTEKQRIILATNIAETSLTIPGITLVIDSGLERRSHQRNGRTVLGLHPISQASSAQRRGRAGRVRPGQCWRLWGQYAPLEALTPPELLREELAEPMLAAACAGAPLAGLDFIDPLPAKALALASDKLTLMAAVDGDGHITAAGRALFALPLDVQFAHLITGMPDDACRAAMVDLACALSQGQRLFRLPTAEDALTALNRWQPRPCDATTLLHLLRRTAPPELAVDPELLSQGRQMANDIRQTLGLAPLAIDATPDWPHERFCDAVIRTLPALAYVRREKRRDSMGNGYSELSPGRDSRLADDALAAIAFDQFSLPGRGRKHTINLGTCMAPFAVKRLRRLGLTERQLEEPRLHADNGEQQLLVATRHLYAGRTVELDHGPADPGELPGLLARLILAGQLLPGLGDRLTDELAAWQLYLTLGDCQTAGIDPAAAEQPAPLPWLTQRLTALGVEQLEDLELLSDEDLQFEGIPDWQREDFNSSFPRQLNLGDLFVRVDYRPAQKLVIVEKTGGLRKTDPKRWELPSWSGWRIRYKIASRMVDIR